MSKNSSVLDTNTIIRFFVDDQPDQRRAVVKLFKQAAPHSLIIPDVIFIEIAFVLSSYYELTKAEIVSKLSVLINTNIFWCHEELLRLTLMLYLQHSSLSIVDCYALATARLHQAKLISFDQKLLKAAGKSGGKP